MRQLFPSLVLLSISGQAQQQEATTVQQPSALLTALSLYEERSPRTKRQCGLGGCGGGCRGYGCGGGGCRSSGCGGYGGYSGGCRGSGCGGGGCANPCGARGRLCCDNVAPRPCVGCGLNRGVFPEPLPIATAVNTCCACCMPTCAPRCINLGGCGSCGGYGGGYDYFDYFG